MCSCLSLSVCLSDCLSVSVCVSPYVCVPVSVSICLSLNQPVCQTIILKIEQSLFLSPQPLVSRPLLKISPDLIECQVGSPNIDQHVISLHCINEKLCVQGQYDFLSNSCYQYYKKSTDWSIRRIFILSSKLKVIGSTVNFKVNCLFYLQELLAYLPGNMGKAHTACWKHDRARQIIGAGAWSF